MSNFFGDLDYHDDLYHDYYDDGEVDPSLFIKNELVIAARDGNTEEVQRQLDTGTDVNFRDEGDLTALYMASSEEHADVMELLLAAEGIDVNVVTDLGETPLFRAVARGGLKACNCY